jgi:crooked neck
VYKECVRVIPHKRFSFSKIWLLFANFEIRQKNLVAARKILGHALGVAPKEKVWQALHSVLHVAVGGGTDTTPHTVYCTLHCARIRTRSHTQTLPLPPPRSQVFEGYIAMELKMGEFDRCRKLYEKYLEWSPENCRAWLRFCELEKSLGETERARSIFEVWACTLSHSTRFSFFSTYDGNTVHVQRFSRFTQKTHTQSSPNKRRTDLHCTLPE